MKKEERGRKKEKEGIRRERLIPKHGHALAIRWGSFENKQNFKNHPGTSKRDLGFNP